MQGQKLVALSRPSSVVLVPILHGVRNASPLLPGVPLCLVILVQDVGQSFAVRASRLSYIMAEGPQAVAVEFIQLAAESIIAPTCNSQSCSHSHAEFNIVVIIVIIV